MVCAEEGRRESYTLGPTGALPRRTSDSLAL